jgi:hypothetical protein
MTNEETRRLRTAHVEAMRMLGEAEDLHDRTEMALAVAPQSLLAHFAHTMARLALEMGREIEADARDEARRSYE